MPYFQWRYCPECGRKLGRTSDGEARRPYCRRCRKFYYHNPPPVVAVLALNSKGRLLAIKRGVEPAYGEWCFVCGFMELLETPEEAVVRELAEESGLKASSPRLIGVFYEDSRIYDSVVVLGYKVTVKGKPRPGSDALDAAFFEVSRLPPLAFKSHRAMLRILWKARGARKTRQSSPS